MSFPNKIINMLNTLKISENRQPLIIAISAFFILALLAAAYFPLKSIAVLGLASFIIITAIKPEFGLYLVALFLPVIFWQPLYPDFKIETSFLDLLAAAALFSFFLRIAYLKVIAGEKVKLELPLIMPFLFFFGAAFFSGVFSDNSYNSIIYSARWVLFPYIAFVFFPANVIKDKKILRNTIVFLLISVLYAALMALFSVQEQNISLLDDIFQGKFFRLRLIKIFGIYPLGDFQNLLAEVMLPGIFFILSLKYWIKSERAKRFINLGMIFFTLILIATFSRGAWISVVLASVAYLFYGHRENLKKYLVYALFILMLSIPAWINMYKIQTYYYIGGLSNQQKVLMLSIAWKAFSENPIIGQGSGEFVHLVENNITYMTRYGEVLDSHGVVQKIMAENGSLGLIAFFIYSLAIFLLFSRTIKNNKNELKLFLPLAAGSLGVFIMEFFNTSYYQGKLWLPIGITLAAIKLLDNNKQIENSAPLS